MVQLIGIYTVQLIGTYTKIDYQTGSIDLMYKMSDNNSSSKLSFSLWSSNDREMPATVYKDVRDISFLKWSLFCILSFLFSHLTELLSLVVEFRSEGWMEDVISLQN